MKIINEKIEFEEVFLKRLEIICDFAGVKPEFKNGSIRKIDKTNISYIEPHKMVVKNKEFLFFNYSNEIYVKNLSEKLMITELESYMKSM